jgi:ectoine hydroxylase-related dioxygenase (phytanoyl-CoA dioxygenase family)
VTESGEPAWNIAYNCRQGTIRNELLTVCVQLSDTFPGNGGFCILPGSHKSNFPVPVSLADFSEYTEHIRQPTPCKGDVLIFTEAALHGTLPWSGDQQRRTLIYRFAPSNTAYGRGYYPQWPESFTRDMTPAQLSVMEAPYTTRMNRPTLSPEGEMITARSRESFKVEFDEKVYGSKYY